MLYQAPSPQRKKEPPPRENKLRLFLKRSSEPLLNLQNSAQQVIFFVFLICLSFHPEYLLVFQRNLSILFKREKWNCFQCSKIFFFFNLQIIEFIIWPRRNFICPSFKYSTLNHLLIHSMIAFCFQNFYKFIIFFFFWNN